MVRKGKGCIESWSAPDAVRKSRVRIRAATRRSTMAGPDPLRRQRVRSPVWTILELLEPSEVAFYSRALKAPRIAAQAASLAERARGEGWEYEQYLAQVLSPPGA